MSNVALHIRRSGTSERKLCFVMPALVAGIPLRKASCPPVRNGRVKPGHDAGVGGLDKSATMTIFLSISLRPKGRFMSVARRGAGCGSFVCAGRVAREAQVQAAPRRGMRPETAVEPFHRWRWSRPVTCRARNAGSSAVRGDFARALSHPSRMRLRACRKPGVPRALRRARNANWNATWPTATPRRKQQGRRSLRSNPVMPAIDVRDLARAEAAAG